MNLNLHQSDVNPLLLKKVRISGGIGLQPNFFSSGQIFWAELAQESWRDLAAVRTEQAQHKPALPPPLGRGWGVAGEPKFVS